MPTGRLFYLRARRWQWAKFGFHCSSPSTHRYTIHMLAYNKCRLREEIHYSAVFGSHQLYHDAYCSSHDIREHACIGMREKNCFQGFSQLSQTIGGHMLWWSLTLCLHHWVEPAHLKYCHLCNNFHLIDVINIADSTSDFRMWLKHHHQSASRPHATESSDVK